jgi:hypothetical protein
MGSGLLSFSAKVKNKSDNPLFLRRLKKHEGEG